jgi:hypothetical protein
MSVAGVALPAVLAVFMRARRMLALLMIVMCRAVVPRFVVVLFLLMSVAVFVMPRFVVVIAVGA